MNLKFTPFLNRSAIRKGKRSIVALVGGTVLAVGLALLVLPGPAFMVIPAGLAILAMEFAWARRWLRKAKGYLPRANSQRKRETTRSLTTEYFSQPGSDLMSQRHSFDANQMTTTKSIYKQI